MIILGCGCGGIIEFLIIAKILSFFGVTGLGWTFKGQIHKVVHNLKNRFTSNKDKEE